MTTRGLLNPSWKMQGKLSGIFTVLCLGKEPEGGVVLGIEIIFSIFYIFYVISLYYNRFDGFTLRMHPP